MLNIYSVLLKETISTFVVEGTELIKQPLVLYLDPVIGMGFQSQLLRTLLIRGIYYLDSFLMLRGSSAHSINDHPSFTNVAVSVMSTSSH